MEDKSSRTVKYKLKRRKRFFFSLALLLMLLVSSVNGISNISTKIIEVRNVAKSGIEGSKENQGSNSEVKAAVPVVGAAEKDTASYIAVKNGQSVYSNIKTDKFKYNKYLILVNKTSNIERDFVPENLREPNVKFLTTSNKASRKMESTAAQAFEELCAAAGKQGITLLAVSGYRSYSYQQNLYDRKVKTIGKTEAEKYVAPPGGSEHQTGLAIDVVSDEYMTLDEGFCKTKAYKWFRENSSEFGL